MFLFTGPSQLIAEVQTGRATPQAPVYATIRPSHSPQNRPSSSIRSSLNSLPAALNSTSLVRSIASEEQPRFHPTNPFYTTLPSNYSSASKLPVPNARVSISTLDRNKPKETLFHEYSSDLKSPSFFTRTLDSGPTSLTYSPYTENTNGHDSTVNLEKSDYFRKFDHLNKQSLLNDGKIKNPFDTKRNSDPFEKYLRPENKINGNCDFDKMPSSISDSNFRSLKETKSSTITELKISEVEEVKTVKKLILNGQEGYHSLKSPMNGKVGGFSLDSKQFRSTQQSPGKETVLSTTMPQRNEPFTATFDQKVLENWCLNQLKNAPYCILLRLLNVFSCACRVCGR
ncbi:putative DCAPL3 [Operophtera brumata]|uniref:Putative DCAPL3 n=1 Tax=Operophtera brumata TaxID=104452 RepID=A0A0L7L6E1_OPEBR|nr:putative DCAPL3 [Operophtera brumata]